MKSQDPTEGKRRVIPCLLRSLTCIQRTVGPMNTADTRACPRCGNEMSGAMEFCPASLVTARSALSSRFGCGKSSVINA